MPDDFGGKKIQRPRHKEIGHLPDDFSPSLQKQRARKASVGMRLARDDGFSINEIFEEAKTRNDTFVYVFEFLQNNGELLDLRLDSFKEQLSPENIRTRIGNFVSDNSLDIWVNFYLNSTQDLPFFQALAEIQKCVGGLKLVTSMTRLRSCHRFFRRCLGEEPVVGAKTLASFLEGSQVVPTVAAEVVYDFIKAVRDAGRKSVWIAFFEGFSVKAGVPEQTGVSVSFEWNSAPMLKSLVEEDQHSLAAYFEEFIRLYLHDQMQSNNGDIGHWQRLYDQHFQMLVNIQSGMFSPNLRYTYGK